jgi:hypothetical protein
MTTTPTAFTPMFRDRAGHPLDTTPDTQRDMLAELAGIDPALHAERLAQRAADLHLLSHGHETGWWNNHGQPAPWPLDYPEHWNPA